MNIISGLLLLAGLIGAAGAGRVMNALGQALRLAGLGAAAAGDLVVDVVDGVWPYVVRALGFLALAMGGALGLIAVGVTTNTTLPILLGGLVGWLALIVLFGGLEVIALAVSKAIGAVEVTAGLGLTILTTVLEGLGLGVKREGRFDLVPEARGFRLAVRAARRKTYALWWIGVALLTVFPSWRPVTELHAGLVAIAIAASALATWQFWQTELYWKLLGAGMVVAFLYGIFSYVRPNTARALWVANAYADHQDQCKLDPNSVDCRRIRAEEAHEAAVAALRASRDALVAASRPQYSFSELVGRLPLERQQEVLEYLEDLDEDMKPRAIAALETQRFVSVEELNRHLFPND